TRNFPHLASIVHTWPMILPSWGALTDSPLRWMTAMHLEFFVFLWTLAGAADHYLAFFAAPLFLAAARAAPSFTPRACALAGAYAAGALLAKYQGIYL